MESPSLSQAHGAVTDAARIEAVRSTALLDTPAELSFDRLTRLAARLLGTPVTFISLIDEQRDFYKSCFGFPEPLASERQQAGTTFCHFTLLSDGPLVINDTLADPVHREVPTVKTLGVRAYLGIPLIVAGGQAIGSFCAIDFQPRVWSELDIEVMSELAMSTLREIELRMALEEIERDRARLQILAATNENLYNEAHEANLEKDRFFAAVTHELRTPMTSILGWARLLTEDVSSQDATEALEMIEISARAQARLVDDLVDASRISSGKIALTPRLIDLNGVLLESIRGLTPSARAKGVELTTSLQALPPLFVDPSRTRQIFDNLISNAIKFTPDGGNVGVSSEAISEQVQVCVRDTGRGIDPDVLPRIFERGWQSNTAEQGGLGLGLTIASHLARAQDGTIRAESEGLGHGATFIVTLPAGNEEVSGMRA